MSKHYQSFLYSPEWKAIAALRKQKDENKCSVCGSTENLEVHHKNYNIHPQKGLLSLDNLITLYHDCHSSEHGYKYGMRYFDEPRRCRTCAWMNNKHYEDCLCLKRESEWFGEFMDNNDVCDWYWPWTTVREEDRMGWWSDEECQKYIAKGGKK